MYETLAVQTMNTVTMTSILYKINECWVQSHKTTKKSNWSLYTGSFHNRFEGQNTIQVKRLKKHM